MIPYRCTHVGIFHIVEMVVDDSFQVFVDTKQSHGTKLWQHHVEHDVVVVA